MLKVNLPNTRFAMRAAHVTPDRVADLFSSRELQITASLDFNLPSMGIGVI
jgi:hypothetical protein